MMLELSKSMRWWNDHECFPMFDPLAQVMTFLMCSFLGVAGKRDLPGGVLITEGGGVKCCCGVTCGVIVAGKRDDT